MLTIIWHCLFTFVCVNDLLCIFYFSKHINMLVVFFERGDVDRRQFCRCMVGVSGVPSGPYCMCKTKTAACALRIKCCVLESCCSFDGSFPSLWLSPQYWSSSRIGSEKMFTWACLTTFFFWSISNGLWNFLLYQNSRHFFSVLAPDLQHN